MMGKYGIMEGWGKSQKESEPAPVGSIIPSFHYSIIPKIFC
jgi:hypothetical protein